MKRCSWLYVGLLIACSKNPEPAPEPRKEAPPPGSLASASAPSTGAMGEIGSALAEIAWDTPTTWQSVPNPNAMRKATYKVPRAAGDAEDAELSVSAASGGVEANVKRWAGQFGGAAPKTETKKVNGLAVTVVEIRGTYAGGGPMMGAAPGALPKEKQMLLGAVVEAGERQHFFKLIGPETTVTAARTDFDSLVASLRAR